VKIVNCGEEFKVLEAEGESRRGTTPEAHLSMGSSPISPVTQASAAAHDIAHIIAIKCAEGRSTDVTPLVVVVGESVPDEELPMSLVVEELVEDVLAGSVAVVVGKMEAAAPTPVKATGMVGESVSVTSLADDWNSLYESFEGGLMAPTIPEAQCEFGETASQKYQIGSESSVMVKFHTPGGLFVSFPMPRRPLLNPPSRGVQGASRDDWVTLWFLPTKEKDTMSPIDALVIIGGTKNKPWSPTWTWNTFWAPTTSRTRRERRSGRPK